MGRKSTFDPALAAGVCELLSLGASLRQACGELGVNESTVRLWAKTHSEFAAQYAQATLERAAAQAESVQEDYEAEPERGPDGKIDPGWVALQRLKIDTKKWMASKMLPKVYGDKIETTVQGPNGGPVEITEIRRVIVDSGKSGQ